MEKCVWEHPIEIAEIRKSAGLEYKAKYNAAKKYQKILSIYQDLIQFNRGIANG